MTWVSPAAVADILDKNHYLGRSHRGDAWSDEAGVLIFAAPTSRRLPIDWLDLTRWCILSREKNAGSQQWGRVVRGLKLKFPEVTTVVSYSDPGAGHKGALYRACNWLWAPTWHRLRPPSGQGSWSGKKQETVKDRWVFCLKPDARRTALLVAKDEAILRKLPWARYQEPGGANFKRWQLEQLM